MIDTHHQPHIIIISYIMHDREDRVRKSHSSSFSSQQSPTILRANSLSNERMTHARQEQKQEQFLLEKVIERLPQGDDEWKMVSVEQKRNIPGFKSRIVWTSMPRDIRALFKFSFTNCFFNQMGTISEGDLIIELEELTFEMSLDDKIALQEKIDSIIMSNMDQMKGRGFVEEWKRQNDYLRAVLIELGEQLKKLSETRKKVPVDKVDQKMINRRQILYPAPVTFSWNPLGSLCVTQNRYPILKRSLIGQPSALRKYFEAGRQQMANTATTGQQQQDVQMAQSGKLSLFDWQVDEEVYMIIFKPQEAKVNDYFDSRTPAESEAVQRSEEEKGAEDVIDLGSLSRLPIKLRKAYERYFGGGERPGQFHRYDKLKVYDILSLSRQDEDDIVFLIERITARPPGTSSAEIAFQNYLTVYPCLFNRPLDRLRYDILAKQLSRDIADPQISFGAYLRVFVLENYFFASEIERYFKQQYRILGTMPHPQLYGLGSYCKFDNVRSELIFMDLLRHFLKRTQDFASIKVKGIHAKRRSCPSRLCLQGVVSQELKNTFLMGLFPLLIVKDRQMERFQFKKIKKIVSANARVTSFIKKMNELVIKLEEGRTTFLKNVVEEFFRFHEDLQQSNLQPQRLFLTHCGNCQKVTHSYNLPTQQQTQTCHRCKNYRSFAQII